MSDTDIKKFFAVLSNIKVIKDTKSMGESESTPVDESYLQEVEKMDIPTAPQSIPTHKVGEKEQTDNIDLFCTFWKKNLLPHIAEFYITESIIATSTKPSCKMTRYYESNVAKVMERRSVLIDELALFFQRYIYMICVGELRHSKTSKSVADSIKIPKWVPRGPRHEAWRKAWDTMMEASEEEILKRCMWMLGIFNENRWSSSFGGKRWGKIMRHLLGYLVGEKDILQFVDGAVCLVHNNTYMVDKLGVPTLTLQNMLNAKALAKNAGELYTSLKHIELKTLNKYSDFIKWIVTY